jgi:hypothetical protein
MVASDTRSFAAARLWLYNPRIASLRCRPAAMRKSDLLCYKDLLLAKQQELSASKSLAGSSPAASDRRVSPTRAVLRQTQIGLPNCLGGASMQR